MSKFKSDEHFRPAKLEVPKEPTTHPDAVAESKIEVDKASFLTFCGICSRYVPGTFDAHQAKTHR